MPVGSQEFLTAGAALVADVLERFGRVQIRALGTSMAPTIQSGDILDVQACTDTPLLVGDIVLMAGSGGLRAHRIVRTRRHGTRTVVVTRGDAHWRTDAIDAPGEVLGRVARITRAHSSSAVSREFSLLDRVGALAAAESTRGARAVRCLAMSVISRMTFEAR